MYCVYMIYVCICSVYMIYVMFICLLGYRHQRAAVGLGRGVPPEPSVTV